MSNPESFIDEVSEEVRKDRMSALLKRWGWVAILAVVVLVGGAAWSEWSKARDAAEAQAFGDTLMAAVTADGMDARRDALAEIAPEDADQAAILALLRATAAMNGEGGDVDAARTELLALAEMADVPQTYRDLALIKVMLAGGTGDAAQDGQILETLTAPGAPYRTLAVEQQALMALRAGDEGTAVTLLRALLDDAETTAALRQRAQQLIVALGATVEPA